MAKIENVCVKINVLDVKDFLIVKKKKGRI